MSKVEGGRVKSPADNYGYEYRLASNSALLTVKATLETTLPDWDVTAARASDVNVTSISLEGAVGLMGEMLVYTSLDTIADDNDINLNPINNGAKRGLYRFNRYRDGSYVATSKKTGYPAREYDTVIEAKGLPAVGEIKMPNLNAKGRRRFIRTLEPDTVNAKLGPIHDYYQNTDVPGFGYLAITTQGLVDQLRAGNDHGMTRAAKFTAANGLIVGLPVDLAEIHERSAEIKAAIDSKKKAKIIA